MLSYSSKSEEVVKYIYKKLKRFRPRLDKSNGIYRVITPVNECFTKIRKKWYRNGKKYIIPPDLNLDKTSLFLMYIGDGCLSCCDSRYGNCQITLATHCFKKESLEKNFLPKIRKILPFPKSVQLQRHLNGKQYYVRIGRKGNVSAFLKYIGKCPFKDENIRKKWKAKNIKYIIKKVPIEIKKWTKDEKKIIKFIYSDKPRHEILRELPNRTWRAITEKANRLGLKRERRIKRDRKGRFTSQI